MWGDVPVTEVKQVWADGLGTFSGEDIRAGIERAIAHHRDFPPTLPQFVALCREERRLRVAGAAKLAPPAGVPCPPEIKAQIDETLAKMRARAAPPKVPSAAEQLAGLAELGAKMAKP